MGFGVCVGGCYAEWGALGVALGEVAGEERLGRGGGRGAWGMGKEQIKVFLLIYILKSRK